MNNYGSWPLHLIKSRGLYYGYYLMKNPLIWPISTRIIQRSQFSQSFFCFDMKNSNLGIQPYYITLCDGYIWSQLTRFCHPTSDILPLNTVIGRVISKRVGSAITCVKIGNGYHPSHRSSSCMAWSIKWKRNKKALAAHAQFHVRSRILNTPNKSF